MTWRRNYWAVWPSLFCVSVGLMAFVPMLPLYVEERFGLTDPADVRSWAGAIFAAAPFTAALAGPVWGSLGDRIGRKPMTLRAMWAIGVTSALMPLADSPVALLLLRMAHGVLAGYVAPAMSLGTVDAPAERQGRTIGSLQVALALGLLVGPIVGAEVATAFDRRAVFYCTSGLAFAGSLPVLFLASEDRAKIREHRRSGGSILGDIGKLVGSKVVAWMLLGVFALRFGQTMTEPYIALWVRELGPLSWFSGTVEHSIDRTVAIAFAILAVAQMLFTPVWGRLSDRSGPLRCLVFVALGLGAALIAIGMVRTIEGFLLLRCVAAVFMAGSMTLAYAALSKRVSPASRSLAFACIQSCMQFGMSLGPFFGGFLSRWTGLATMFFVAGGLLLIVSVGLARLRRMPLAA